MGEQVKVRRTFTRAVRDARTGRLTCTEEVSWDDTIDSGALERSTIRAADVFEEEAERDVASFPALMDILAQDREALELARATLAQDRQRLEILRASLASGDTDGPTLIRTVEGMVETVKTNASRETNDIRGQLSDVRRELQVLRSRVKEQGDEILRLKTRERR